MKLTLMMSEKGKCFKCDNPFIIQITNKQLNQVFNLCEIHYKDFIIDYGFISVLSNEEYERITKYVDEIIKLREPGLTSGYKYKINE